MVEVLGDKRKEGFGLVVEVMSLVVEKRAFMAVDLGLELERVREGNHGQLSQGKTLVRFLKSSLL